MPGDGVSGEGEPDVPTVVFLCVHNAGRSQMAAGWAEKLGGRGIRVFSGGSDPAARVNPAVVKAMQEVGMDIAARRPRRWTEDVVLTADVVVTMGCGDSCPIVPGTRYEDWDLPDPAGQGLESVRPIRDDIEHRVRALLAELRVPTSA
jgi:arsenate reductase (thioredoxin)